MPDTNDLMFELTLATTDCTYKRCKNSFNYKLSQVSLSFKGGLALSSFKVNETRKTRRHSILTVTLTQAFRKLFTFCK